MSTFPEPAGAARVDKWDVDGSAPDGTPNVFRRFNGETRKVGPVEVAVDGVQHGDGRIERHIYIGQGGSVGDLSSTEARQMAQVLIAASDEIENR